MISWLDETWIEKKPIGYNYSGRPENIKVNAIVLHYTAGGHYQNSAWNWFRNPDAKASSHFIVGRKGQILQCVDLNNKAWHVGTSEMMYNKEMTSNVNNFSIGIELANFGLLQKSGNEFYYALGRERRKFNIEKYGEPVKNTLKFHNGYKIEGYWEVYHPYQIAATTLLCKKLIEKIPAIKINRIVGHEKIAMPLGRKTDPGPCWNWKVFRESLAEEKQKNNEDDNEL